MNFGIVSPNPAIPNGGSVGQVLAKASNNDLDLTWVSASAGGGIAAPDIITVDNFASYASTDLLKDSGYNATSFLASNGKSTDSDRLDGSHSTDFALIGHTHAIGLPTFYTLTSELSVNSTTLTDVNDWSFSVTSGYQYRIQIIAAYMTATATTGGEIAIYCLNSASGTIRGYWEGGVSNATVATELKAPVYAIGASNAAGSKIITSAVSSTTGDHYIGGDMVFTCTASGTVRIQWASEVAASAAMLRKNSALIVTRLV